MKYSSHLTENNISYIEHMKRAFSISYRMISTGLKMIVHGIIPCVWITAATDTVNQLNIELNGVPSRLSRRDFL